MSSTLFRTLGVTYLSIFLGTLFRLNPMLESFLTSIFEFNGLSGYQWYYPYQEKLILESALLSRLRHKY